MSHPKSSKRQQAKKEGHFIDYLLRAVILSSIVIIMISTAGIMLKTKTYTNCTVENITGAHSKYEYVTSCGNFFEHEKASMGVGYTYNIEAFKVNKQIQEVELLSDLKK